MRRVIEESDLTALEANVRRGKVGGAGVSSSTARFSRDGAGARPALSSPLTLALTGQLPSGKNQVQLLFRKGEVHKYPNKTFTNWRSKAYLEILEQANWGGRTIITRPVRLTVEYWPGDARTRDVSGQLDALFHLLVYSKVLKDDGLVHDVIWRRQAMNRRFPKVFMVLEAL